MHKQDLRVQKTIRQIDQALLSTLKKTPFERITVDMLCREAMINRSTFYRYYEDKFDMLNNFMNRTLNDFRSAVRVDFVLATAADVIGTFYQDLFGDLMEHIRANRDIYLTLAGGSISRNIWYEMTEIIRESIYRELQKSDSITEQNEKYMSLYSRLFSEDVMSIVLWWFEYFEDLSIEDVKNVMNSNIREGYFKAFKSYL